MSEKQRVGQLLMVDCPTTGVTAATTDAISRYAVGSVILDGTSSAGVQETAVVTRNLQSLAPKGTKLFIATDQEGGQVQRLQGPGFTRIVSGVQQGAITPARLEGFARGWGAQLVQAGVNVNLAPVLDTVPANFGTNPPIGDLDREYGHTPAVVAPHVAAFVRGMNAGGVETSVKHFPGLGRATGNTDLARNVTDPTTKRSPYLRPFRAGVDAGSSFVMVSSATYPHIDKTHRACFSRTVIGSMLRGQLGFDGVVVSDDLGAVALKPLSWGTRATRFIDAGGTMLLTVTTAHVGAMTKAVRSRAAASPAFAAKVKAAVMTVLVAKAQAGLLS